MSRWLITGAGGQLGKALVSVLDDDVVALGRKDLDITDSAAVFDAIQYMRPSIVVNAAAYTAVDAAEADEEQAFAVNAQGAGHIAAACSNVGALLVHISTDYVFAGGARTPYRETATAEPATAYGRSKLAGEREVLRELEASYVVRSSWIFDGRGANFLTTMLRLEQEQECVSVVDDQRGSPTWARDLATALIALATSQAPFGVYHCTNSGETTWFGFAQAIFSELGADPNRVVPISTDAAARPASRPAYSVLDMHRWLSVGLPRLPRWEEALHSALLDMQAKRTLAL